MSLPLCFSSTLTSVGLCKTTRALREKSRSAHSRPTFHLFDEHDVRGLWETCNKLGLFAARERIVDPIVRKRGGVIFVDEDATDVELERMAKPDWPNFMDRWLEDYAQTGATPDMIFERVCSWLTRRQTLAALRLACDVLVTVGERRHLALFDAYAGREEEADSLKENARYAVMRRSLI